MATAMKGMDTLKCIGFVLLAAVLLFFLMQSSSGSYIQGPSSGVATLPCLNDNMCPIGQSCSNGSCSEGFETPTINVGSKDMSSCTAAECSGINAACPRSESPCSSDDGEFCQGGKCIKRSVMSEAAALDQIGDLPL